MQKPDTIIDKLYQRAEQFPAHIAIKYKDKGRWQYYRWTDVLQIAEALAGYLNGLDLKPNDKLGILSDTRPEWFLADLGALMAQKIVVPIYPSLLPDDIRYIINDSQIKVLILEDDEQFKKWTQIKDECPSVETLIQLDSFDKTSHEKTPLWPDIISEGRKLAKETQKQIKSVAQSISLDDIATILYTSGTTGLPKGVVLAHEQIMSELEDAFHVIPVTDKDLTLTFLPFSHILGRVEAWGCIYAGYTLGFAENIDRIRSNLLELKPTFMIGVPRIFEKLYTAILAHVETKPTSKRLFKAAAHIARKMADDRANNESSPWSTLLQYQVFDRLIFENIRNQLGGKIRYCISGGAPLSPEIAKFFYGCGVLILEGYGLTETTAGVTFNTPLRYKFGTVGPALNDVDIRIAADGEILIKSKKNMKKYYNNEEATAEAFDGEYFKTGDIGEVDADGFLKITDRKKDLIKTAGGKYVAPQRLEGVLKLNPYISQVLIHGDQRKYIVALITLNETNIKTWAEQHKIGETKYYTHPEVRSLIKNAVAEANTQLSSFESIKKFAILEHDFSIERGELTPSLKVKRKVCDQKYRNEIEDLYD
jgi:long-chain acyl-CoA synthetase